MRLLTSALHASLHRLGLPALAATALMLGACASAPPTLAPNPQLFVQGIPPVPQALVDNVARYTEFRGHGFADWHPERREMLIVHRKAGASTNQLYRLTSPMAELEQLTDFADPVSEGQYDPRDGRFIVFARSTGGNEADQLYRLDLDTRAVTLLTNPSERHGVNLWLHGRAGRDGVRPPARVVVASQPLDRTAQGGRRATVNTVLSLLDPLKPESRRTLAELPGGGWEAAAVTPDDSMLALHRYVSANESETWLMDLATGERRRVLPAAAPAGAAVPATFKPDAFEADGRGLLLTTDRDGEFQNLVRLDLATGAISSVTGHIRWDANLGSQSADGALLALRTNEDGLRKLRLFDGRSLKEMPAAPLPIGAVGTVGFHHKTAELAVVLNSSAGPGQIFSLNPSTGAVTQWTRAQAAPGVDPTRFADQQIIRWKSFDGLTISGLITRAPAQRFPGKRPVLINIHGGPEAQSTIGFNGRGNYFIEELGITVIRPNVRGSSGYGKTFLALDNGFKREDSVKDIGALLDWIATQPDLDPSRVLVIGGSYGGYMSLAVATHYADRIAGNIDIVGISNFVTFLNNTESYRRDLRRVEYGDERDPAMRAHLEKISPLTNASKITKPMFVVQGRNDPRVPWTEAEQMVAKARTNGTPVWYLRAENEGHGFQRKENADYEFFATILFMQQTLLK